VYVGQNERHTEEGSDDTRTYHDYTNATRRLSETQYVLFSTHPQTAEEHQDYSDRRQKEAETFSH